jgi:signal peptidase II
MATKTKKASPGAKPVYKSSSASLLPWFGIALVVILLDQVTKLTVERTFAYGETVPLTSFFNLIKVYNPGAAFSFLGDAGGWQRYFFTGIAIAAVGFILYLMIADIGISVGAFLFIVDELRRVNKS